MTERLGFQEIIATICGNCLQGRRLFLSLTRILRNSPEMWPWSIIDFSSNVRVDISFYMTYFYCAGCHLGLCVNCHNSHAYIHAKYLSRFTTMPWNAKSKDFNENRDCSECSRNVRCRVECTACHWSDCLKCDRWFEHHRQDLSSKDHKQYLKIVPPYSSLNSVNSERCRCLSGFGIWSHCPRCNEGDGFSCPHKKGHADASSSAGP